MLRFYDGLSFREIATRLRQTEAASQRRGHRALEKLARRLRRKGAVTASVAILGAGLAAQFTVSVPAALSTASLASGAMASAPTISAVSIFTNLIHTMSQTKTATLTAGTIAIALIPLGMQRNAITEQKRKITQLDQQAWLRSVAISNYLAPMTFAHGTADEQIARVYQLDLEPDELSRFAGAALNRHALRSSAELREWAFERLGPSSYITSAGGFFERWFKADPAAAQAALDLLPDGELNNAVQTKLAE